MSTRDKLTDNPLHSLAALSGVDLSWADIQGESHAVNDDTLLAILKSLDIPCDSSEECAWALETLETASLSRFIPHVLVVRQSEFPACIPLNVSKSFKNKTLTWRLFEEMGREHRDSVCLSELEETGRTGKINHLQWELHLDVDLGYHKLWIDVPDGDALLMNLVVVPDTCYLPAALKSDARLWGPSVQLYALRSQRNWGMGDFTDLSNLLDWCVENGAGVLGVNPLHCLFPDSPQDASPYSPSSRLFLNPLYLDVEAIPDFPDCEKARKHVLSPEFQAQLETLRQTPLVDYQAVMALKRPILEWLFQTFHERHLAMNSSPRAFAFHDFVEEGGESLQRLAVFQALQDRFHSEDPLIWGWPVWPEMYQDPASEAVAEFIEANRERIMFFQYLQWQAHEQLQEIGRKSYEKNMPVGLYLDLAVGVERRGEEVWSDQELFAHEMSVGAPPDEHNQKGQSWGLVPMIPQKLYERSYDPMVDIFRKNMTHAGALRIDHVMSLMRLFWVPKNRLPEEGAYVNYAMDDLFGILALESHRNRCMVIGEDLGTVPDEIRESMERWGVFSYKVFYFEKTSEGEFTAPSGYPVKAAVTLSTHDLPTVHGYWQSYDIGLRSELDLYPTPELEKAQIKSRMIDRMGVLSALDKDDIAFDGQTTDPASLPYMTTALSCAIHQYLARTPSQLQLVQFEDVLEQVEQVNVPGTSYEHPNWRRKLPASIETFNADARIQRLVDLLSTERDSSRVAIDDEPVEGSSWSGLTMPNATYRIQLGRHFRFKDAEKLTSYWKRLGISHCYTSPLLSSRVGSTHGYDITDHKRLDSVIGGQEDFDRLVHALRQKQIGTVVDIVPNHMGIGSDNPWWMDVLENGPASVYADYFDIDWHSLKKELNGKVLLPVLGGHYGQVLSNGELSLRFEPKHGRLTLHYYEHMFPINPQSYGQVLGHRLDVLEARLGNSNPAFYEFQSIITAFERLPAHTEVDEALREERLRERAIAINRLSTLCLKVGEIGEFIQENLNDFLCASDDPTNVHRLHRLLEHQAYRLAYWRVAMDEINYRRFFDINDLAALRMEDPRVFDATHALILKLVEEGKIQGVRIDHPDGLFEPAQYFERLQEECRQRLGVTDPDENPLYIAVEKILAPHERIPENWAVHGTTGYDFCESVGGLFIDQGNLRAMNRIYQRFTGRASSEKDFETLVYQCKKLIMETSLASELSVLSHKLNRISETDWSARDYTQHQIRNALLEVVACFPVYRTYISEDGVSRKDRDYIEWAISSAKKQNTAIEPSIYDFIRKVLLQELEGARSQDLLRFVMSFQQYTGPVMAKSLEDTAFYRYNRLVALNEVGGEPGQFGTSVISFHYENQERLEASPHAMLTTSTHDTKRSEDVRARLCVLSEIPDVWHQNVGRWSRLNRSRKTNVDGVRIPTRNDEYLFYQTLLGIWPMMTPAQAAPDEAVLENLSERCEAYMLKAIREAKENTSWINQDVEYEEAMSRFVQEVLTPSATNVFVEEFHDFVQDVVMPGMVTSLSQTLLKLTSPGVPDIYQGNEVWNLSLVDPDNRRSIDYGRLTDQLNALTPLLTDRPFEQKQDLLVDLIARMRDGSMKLYVTAAALEFRRRHPNLFMTGEYIPLEVTGEQAEHVVAFARRTEDAVCITVVPRLVYWLTSRDMPFPPEEDAWDGTMLVLPDALRKALKSKKLTHTYTGESVSIKKGQIPVSAVLKHFPVALLTFSKDA